MNRALTAALGKLYRAEQGNISGSSLSPAQRQALDLFARQTGAVGLKPRGRGVIYQVLEMAIIERHFRHQSPLDERDLLALPERAANIGRTRDSKGGRHTHAHHYFLLKAVGQGVRWSQPSGYQLDLSAQTHAQGASALAVNADAPWRSEQPLWLVENQALFDQNDWLPETPVSLGYYPGQLSAPLLDWLAKQQPVRQLVFFPDYDGVGLANYLRLCQAMPEPPRFWLMPGWQDKLTRYGSASLWQNTRVLFERAAVRLKPWIDHTPLAELVTAMQAQGLALEQETLWLSEDLSSGG